MQLERLVQLALDLQVDRVELVAHQQAARIVVRREHAACPFVVLDAGGGLAGAQQREADVEARLTAQRVAGPVAQRVERLMAELAGAADVDVDQPLGLREQQRRLGGGVAQRGGLVRGGGGRGQGRSSKARPPRGGQSSCHRRLRCRT